MTIKFGIGFLLAVSLTATACGNPQYGPQAQEVAAACTDANGDPAQCATQVAQSGGSFVQDHPYLTAGAAAAGAYYLGKRNERRRGYSTPYYAPRTVVRRTIVRSVPSYTRSYSAPRSYRTVTRTVRYRR